MAESFYRIRNNARRTCRICSGQHPYIGYNEHDDGPRAIIFGPDAQAVPYVLAPFVPAARIVTVDDTSEGWSAIEATSPPLTYRIVGEDLVWEVAPASVKHVSPDPTHPMNARALVDAPTAIAQRAALARTDTTWIGFQNEVWSRSPGGQPGGEEPATAYLGPVVDRPKDLEGRLPDLPLGLRFGYQGDGSGRFYAKLSVDSPVARLVIADTIQILHQLILDTFPDESPPAPGPITRAALRMGHWTVPNPLPAGPSEIPNLGKGPLQRWGGQTVSQPAVRITADPSGARIALDRVRDRQAQLAGVTSGSAEYFNILRQWTEEDAARDRQVAQEVEKAILRAEEQTIRQVYGFATIQRPPYRVSAKIEPSDDPNDPWLVFDAEGSPWIPAGKEVRIRQSAFAGTQHTIANTHRTMQRHLERQTIDRIQESLATNVADFDAQLRRHPAGTDQFLPLLTRLVRSQLIYPPSSSTLQQLLSQAIQVQDTTPPSNWTVLLEPTHPWAAGSTVWIQTAMVDDHWPLQILVRLAAQGAAE